MSETLSESPSRPAADAAPSPPVSPPRESRPRDGRRPQRRLDLRVRGTADAVGEFIAYWGFKAVHGRIWTVLAVRSAPMTQVEIAEFLGVSRSLVSGAMSELASHGLVAQVEPSRNAPFRAVFDIWPSIAGVLRSREWMLIESSRVALEGAIEEWELASAVDRSDYDIDRLRFLLRLTEMAQAFLRFLIGIRMPSKFEGVTSWLRTSSELIKSLRELR